MDFLLKRHFWIVRLAFIALASWLVAQIANSVADAALEPPVSLATGAAKPGAAAPPAATNLEAGLLGRLFGMEPPPPVVEQAPVATDTATSNETTAEEEKPADEEETPHTTARVQLLGTMVANPARFSHAVIMDLDAQTTDYYALGQEVRGLKIRKILRNPSRVIVFNPETGKLELIDATPGSGQGVKTDLGKAAVPPPATPAAQAQTPAAAPALEGVTQKGENEYSITKARMDSSLGNLNDMATQARAIPSFKNGVSNGFKLFSIKPGSLYGAIGIQNGDVIQRINGLELNSPDKALEMYARLKEAQNVEIEIERHGTVIKKRYSIE